MPAAASSRSARSSRSRPMSRSRPAEPVRRLDDPTISERLAEQVHDLRPRGAGPLAHHAQGAVHEEEVRRDRHVVVVPRLRRHDRRDPARRQRRDGRRALLLGTLRHHDDARVVTRHAVDVVGGEGPPEVLARRAAGGQERQQRGAGRALQRHAGRASLGQGAIDVVQAAEGGLGRRLGDARHGADPRGCPRGGGRLAPELRVADPEVVEGAQDVGVAAQQPDDEHAEERGDQPEGGEGSRHRPRPPRARCRSSRCCPRRR